VIIQKGWKLIGLIHEQPMQNLNEAENGLVHRSENFIVIAFRFATAVLCHRDRLRMIGF